MTIGLLSDTHGFLDPRIFDYFASCDEIWHAGDFGSLSIADQLEEFKPLRGVFGNIDDRDLQSRFPEDFQFACEGFNVMITHIGGAPPTYNKRVKSLLKSTHPDIFVCGHSHVLRIGRDPGLNNMLYINPGAAGNQGFHHMRTLVRMSIANHKVENLEVIELGKRGSLDE